jgi:uncharacterized protein YdeI (YjbR/CyaY-like superfamily)
MAPVYFASREEFREWLAKNHASERELLVGFHKVSSGKPGATYSEVLDEALCFGWIDGVRRSINSTSYMIRFTPRKLKSIWSLVNVRRVAALQAAGKMSEAGLKTFALREAHRTGIYAFEQKNPGLAEKYKKVFRKDPVAWKFFMSQAPWYQRTAGHWVSRAKQEETRLRRLAKLMKDSGNGKRIDMLSPSTKGKGRREAGGSSRS